jgi:hypothetical protein
MRVRLWSVAWMALFAVALGLMWYQTFEVTGVTAAVVPPGVERPAAPPVPDLAPVPVGQANIDLFARAHPVWSGFTF